MVQSLPIATACTSPSLPLAEAAFVDAEYHHNVPPNLDDSDEAACSDIDRELELRRAIVRERMRRVLEEALHHRSILWRPWREAGAPQDAPARRPFVTAHTFRKMAYLDRNFNMLDHERVRWQDGSFAPFYARWRKLVEVDAAEHGLRPLLELTGENAAAIVDERGGADISDAVRAEVDKVRELDRSIREYARFLAHVQPLLAARAETRAAEERARERADLEAEEAHRMRVVTAIGVACS